METLTKTRTVGGSLIVTLPKELVKAEELKEGQIVRIEVKKIRKSGFGILRGIKPFRKEEELKGQLEEKR